METLHSFSKVAKRNSLANLSESTDQNTEVDKAKEASGNLFEKKETNYVRI